MMSSTGDSEQVAAQLDPFLVPPPSTSRLVLLVMAMGAASSFIGSWILVLGRDSWRGRNRACAIRLGNDTSRPLSAVMTFNHCLSKIARDQALASLAGPLVIAVLAVAGWLAAPRIAELWNHLRTPVDAAVVNELAHLVSAASLTRTRLPRFLHGGRTTTGEPWTFGRRGNYRVAFSSTMLPLLGQGHEASRASIRHELAHLKNHDVDRTYLSLSAWCGFAVISTVFFAAVVTGGIRSVGTAVGFRLLAIVVVVYLSFSAFLRSREHDADLRAAMMENAAADLADALPVSGTGVAPRPHLVRRLVPWRATGAAWSAAVRRHPDPGRREQVIRDPELVMTLRTVEAASAGLIAGLAFGELQQVVNGLVGGRLSPPLWVAGLVVALPVMGVVGLAAWRHAAVARAGRGRAPAFVLPGAAVGIGLILGNELSPSAAAVWSGAVWTSSAWSDAEALHSAAFLPTIVFVAVMVAGGALAMGWVVVAATVWNSACVGMCRRRIIVIWSVYLAVGSIVLAVPFSCCFLVITSLSSHSSTKTLAGWLGTTGWATAIWGSLVLSWVYVVAGRLAAGRPRDPFGYRRRTVALMLFASLVLASVPFVARQVTSPSRDHFRSDAAGAWMMENLPHTRQGYFACLWGQQNDLEVLREATSGLAPELIFGTYLTLTDDPAMHTIGAAYVATAAGGPDRPTSVSTAFIRLCDVEKRYGHIGRANIGNE
jgi:Zn-dependent protease with chaperone function